jgi:hypothetical protein
MSQIAMMILKKKDEPNALKMSDFTIDSEKKSNIDEN